MIQIVNDWVIGFFLHFSALTRNTIYTENWKYFKTIRKTDWRPYKMSK